MIRSISILLTLVHTSYAQTKYATALIRNSDGVTNDIQGVVRFEQYVHDKMTFREIFFFLRTKIQLFFQFFSGPEMVLLMSLLRGKIFKVLVRVNTDFIFINTVISHPIRRRRRDFISYPSKSALPVRPSTVATYRQERVRMTTNCVSLILCRVGHHLRIDIRVTWETLLRMRTERVPVRESWDKVK